MTQVDDPDAPPSEEEVRESQRLRDALEDTSKESPDADLLRAVSTRRTRRRSRSPTSTRRSRAGSLAASGDPAAW